MIAYAHAALPLVEEARPTPSPKVDGDGRRDEALCAQLIARIKDGDLVAFDRLYRHTREDVARTLFHLVGRNAEVEDLLQDTYVHLLKAVRNFRGECSFRTFLYRVCANVALSH